MYTQLRLSKIFFLLLIWTAPALAGDHAFFEDFSDGFTVFTVDDPKASINNGKLMWKTKYFLNTKFKWDVPIEDVAIEFDGYCVKNGFNVYLRNDKNLGYTIILGGWGNKN